MKYQEMLIYTLVIFQKVSQKKKWKKYVKNLVLFLCLTITQQIATNEIMPMLII